MKCPKCGKENPFRYNFCMFCEAELRPGEPIDLNRKPPKVPCNWFYVVVTFIAFWPLSIVALITAMDVDRKLKKGDIEGAKRSSRSVKRIFYFAAVIALIIMGIFFVPGFIRFFS